MKYLRTYILLLLLGALQACNMGKFYAGKRIDTKHFKYETSPENIQSCKEIDVRLKKEVLEVICNNSSEMSIDTCHIQAKKLFIPQAVALVVPDTVSTQPPLESPGTSRPKRTYMSMLFLILAAAVIDGLAFGIIAFLISLISNPVSIAFHIGLMWAIGTALVVFGFGLIALLIFGP